MTTDYATIVADPPWPLMRLASPGRHAFGTQPDTLQSVALPYPTMTIPDIKALPIGDLGARDAHLYIWTVNRFIEDTYGVARSWGFIPKTLLTWAKRPMGLGPGGAFSQTSEHVLFCRRGRDIRLSRTDSTWWTWPRRQHSAKPEAFQDLVETVSPGPYLELFARRARPGWDVWGDEVESDLEIAS